jgi:hypothetical protein
MTLIHWITVCVCIGGLGWIVWEANRACKCGEHLRGDGKHDKACPQYEEMEPESVHLGVPNVLMEDVQDKTLYLYDYEANQDLMFCSIFQCIRCGRPVTVDPEINGGWMVPICECRRRKREEVDGGRAGQEGSQRPKA